MRTDDERIRAIHRRAARFDQREHLKKTRILQGISFGVCFAALIACAFIMPHLAAGLENEPLINNMTASIFSDSNTLGFIVIAVIAFFLGVAATIFCYKLKQWHDNYQSEIRE